MGLVYNIAGTGMEVSLPKLLGATVMFFLVWSLMAKFALRGRHALARPARRRVLDSFGAATESRWTGLALSSRRSDLPPRSPIRWARFVQFMRCAAPWLPTATTFMSSRPASTARLTATCRCSGRSISTASRSRTFRASGCAASTGRRRCAARWPLPSAASIVVHLHAVFLWPILAAARAARAQRRARMSISPRGMLVPELIRRKSRWVKSAWIALVERAQSRGVRQPSTRPRRSRRATLQASAGRCRRSSRSRTASTIRRHLPTTPLSADIAAAIAQPAAGARLRAAQLGEGASIA